MENKVKSTVTGVHPKTGEIHHMEFDGDAVCVVNIREEDDRVACDQCITGEVNANRAIALVKGLTGACRNLLKELPPIVAHIIMNELMNEMLGKMKDDEEEALKAYDEERYGS